MVSKDEYDEDGNNILSIYYDDDGNETDRTEYEYVNGNVVKSTQYSLGVITDIYEIEYDQNGGRIRTMQINADGDKVVLSESECDDNGHTITEQGYSPSGEKLSYSEYEYDSNGNKIKDRTVGPDGTSYGSTEYEYDQYGNEIKSIRYNGDGTVAATDEYEYEYDDEGNVIKRTYYYNGELDEYSEFTSNGTETKRMYKGEDGQLHTMYEAECDSNGNVLKEYWYDLNDEVYNTVEYIYE
jgi:hypothetical protein